MKLLVFPLLTAGCFPRLDIYVPEGIVHYELSSEQAEVIGERVQRIGDLQICLDLILDEVDEENLFDFQGMAGREGFDESHLDVRLLVTTYFAEGKIRMVDVETEGPNSFFIDHCAVYIEAEDVIAISDECYEEKFVDEQDNRGMGTLMHEGAHPFTGDHSDEYYELEAALDDGYGHRGSGYAILAGSTQDFPAEMEVLYYPLEKLDEFPLVTYLVGNLTELLNSGDIDEPEACLRLDYYTQRNVWAEYSVDGAQDFMHGINYMGADNSSLIAVLGSDECPIYSQVRTSPEFIAAYDVWTCDFLN
jgi:hypothetical protein